MRTQEARVGARVRVVDSRKPELRGKVGKIVKGYGAPEHLALEVRLEDGRSELFWRHQLKKEPSAETARRRILRPGKWRTFRGVIGGWRKD